MQSVSQGQICSDSCMCCHTEVEVKDQTCYLIQSQYTDIQPTSSSYHPSKTAHQEPGGKTTPINTQEHHQTATWEYHSTNSHTGTPSLKQLHGKTTPLIPTQEHHHNNSHMGIPLLQFPHRNTTTPIVTWENHLKTCWENHPTNNPVGQIPHQ